MKEKNEHRDKESKTPEQHISNPRRRNEENRNEKKPEGEKVSHRDVKNRARKGYHNDGPGGSYSGF